MSQTLILLLAINLVLVIFAYMLGSINCAIIVCRIMGLADPRTEGSKNPGTTNVLRIGGKKAAIITLLGDTLKGVIPVVIGHWIGVDGLGLGLVALGAFLGHLYPLFFDFQGGKGVATAFGALVALSWPVGLCVLGTWLVVAAIFRYSSLAALIATLLSPLYIWLLANHGFIPPVAVLCIFLIIRHRGNIQRLWAGTESKIGSKKQTS